MASYLIQGSTLTDIADAIRDRTGSAEGLSPLDMPAAIAAIPAGDRYQEGYDAGYRAGYGDGSGGIRPLSYAWDEAALTLNIAEV